MPTKRKISRKRLWLFRIFAVVLIPTFCLLCVEIAVKIFRGSYPVSFVVPSEFDSQVLVDNYKFSWRFFPKALARSSQPIRIQKEKPADSQRIIVLGGSAAMGDPEAAYGFPRVLQVLLEQRHPKAKFEVVNAAVTAVNSHVVLPIAKDCRKLDADAWVVYMGNNEVHGPYGAGTVFGGRESPLWMIRFGIAFQRTCTGQLFHANLTPDENVPESWGGMKMFLDQKVRHDDPSLDRVYKNYEANLDALLSAANWAGVPVVIGTVASNLKDCPPFVSMHDPELEEGRRTKWKMFFEQGKLSQFEGRNSDALDAYAKAAEIDTEFAELQYRMGECQFAIGETEKALEHFTRARDFDALRFRADSRINQIIKDVADSYDSEEVRLIDIAKELDAQSAHGIAGEESIYEHVHFNFHGNYLLASLFAKQLESVLALDAASGVAWASEETCAQKLGLTTYHRIQIRKEMMGRLRSAPFDAQIHNDRRLEKLDQEIRVLQAKLTAQARDLDLARFKTLLEQKPDDWTLRQQYSALLESTGDLEGSIAQWRQICKSLPHYPIAAFKLGSSLNRAKKREEAEKALNRALELRADFPAVYNSLGICLSHLGRFDESYANFQKAIELSPNYAEAYFNWGLVLANQREQENALKKYEQAIEANKDYLPAIEKLGIHYFEAKEYLTAEPYFSEIVRIKPQDVNARNNLGMLNLKIGRKQDAATHFEKTLQLDPNNSLAIRALKSIRGELH